jgi:glycine/serine hydroxymethyltransferase
MGVAEAKQIAVWMDRVISDPSDANAEKVFAEVRELTGKFPAPGITR